MRTISPRATRLAAFLGILSTAACDSPVNPLDAQEASTQAMLAQILDKLDTIEERIDSLEVSVAASGSQPVTLSGLPAEQLDSLIRITSYLAEDVASGSWEACGHVELGGEFGIEWKGEAEGEGAGHLGAWAGTGAYAGGKLTGTAAVGGGFKLEGGGGVEFCHPIGGTAPPVRPTPVGPARAPALDPLRTALDGLTSQFNLTPTTLAASIDGVGNVIAAPGSIGLTSFASVLPLPPAVASIANDPMGTVAGKLTTLRSTAESALCNGSGWGGNISSIISQACGVIGNGGMANFTVMADIANTYPAVETAISTVCTRVNSIGLQRLIIPSWDVTFPLGIGTVQVFPGYNQRLFASYTSVACP